MFSAESALHPYNLVSVSRATEARKVVISAKRAVNSQIWSWSGHSICHQARQSLSSGNLQEVTRKCTCNNSGRKQREAVASTLWASERTESSEASGRGSWWINFDYDTSGSVGFCESCIGGKHPSRQAPAQLQRRWSWCTLTCVGRWEKSPLEALSTFSRFWIITLTTAGCILSSGRIKPSAVSGTGKSKVLGCMRQYQQLLTWGTGAPLQRWKTCHLTRPGMVIGLLWSTLGCLEVPPTHTFQRTAGKALLKS